MAREKNLKLINNVPDELPFINADENRVQQILYNIIGNSIKFTDSGNITISAKEKDGFIVTSVSDTGIGIDENNYDKIFESFEQADGSTAREYGGTGLGLSISKKLVELHGGEINVSSQVGIGSTFTFSLLIYKGNIDDKQIREISKYEVMLSKLELEDSTEIRKEKTKQISNGIEILVVDDEQVNRKVLNNYLSMEGYNVTEASSGIEALDLIKNKKQFDLIILDIMMPKMSGYEVCDKLREIFMPSQLPIVMLTAKNRIDDLVEGFNIGANDYLVKPFSKDELLSRIKTHLNLYGINKAAGKFVPYEFLKAIGRESISDVRLGDFKEKEVTVFFSDIRDYTHLSEKMTPEQNFNFINAYVGRMGPIILKYEGFVNQYLGDAIIAMFPKKADNSLKAAVSMQKAIQEYNKDRIKDKKQSIAVGMGLHTGPLVMGIIGDQKRNDTATIADTVNAASRMEGMTKYFGANIVISETTLKLIEDRTKFNTRYLGKVQLKGKDIAIGVYECYDGDEDEILSLKKETSELFKEGINKFLDKDFAESSAIFDRIIKKNPDDKVAMHFRQRAAHYMIEGVEESWIGIERLESK